MTISSTTSNFPEKFITITDYEYEFARKSYRAHLKKKGRQHKIEKILKHNENSTK